ncbi:MAG TPA: hypothetical protein VF131_27895 [Blastocatellia bacterium]|nr:hypothetical protein [Blastocatellia bacterium]
MNRLAFLLAGALVASACAKAPEDHSPAAPQVSEKADAGDRDQSLESLTRAFRNLGAVKTFRANMLSDRKQEGIIESKVTAVLPDRFHLVNDSLEVKVIGSDLYRRFPDGSWKKASQSTDITGLLDPKKLEAYISSAVEIKLVGEEELDGVPSEVYEASLPHIPATRGAHDRLQPFAAKVWVSKQDRLPRKLEGTALVSQVRTEVVYYDYNAKIKVQPPAN